MSPETALLEAVQAALLANADVAALVGEKVFDAVPGDDQPGTPPLIYAGPFNRRRYQDVAWTVTGRFFVQSTGFDRREAWNIAETAIQAVDEIEPTLAGPFAVADMVRVSQAGDVLTKEGGFHSVFFDLTTTIQRVT